VAYFYTAALTWNCSGVDILKADTLQAFSCVAHVRSAAFAGVQVKRYAALRTVTSPHRHVTVT